LAQGRFVDCIAVGFDTMTRMTLLHFFAVHAAVLAVATTTEAEPEAMSTSMASEPEPAAGTTLQTYTQTVVQTVTLTNLDNYNNLAALQAAYTAQMATASATDSSQVTATVTAVVVKVSMSLTGVNSTHIDQVKQAIATLAGVDVSAVTLEQSRRLLEQPQKLEIERRLATTNWAAEVTVPSSSGDMVSAAKTIHTALNNNETVASAVGDQTGTNVTATTTTSLKLTMSTVLVTTSALDTPALDTHMGDYFGGTVVTDSHVGGPSTSASSLLDNSDDAPWGSGYILVGLVSVLFGVQANLGLLVK
jgi:hypothetical protein